VAGRARGGLASQLRGVWLPAVWMSVWLMLLLAGFDLNERLGNLTPYLAVFRLFTVCTLALLFIVTVLKSSSARNSS